MKQHPDFEGALEHIFNEYKLVDSHLVSGARFRLDFARHVARSLRGMGIGLHAIGEPDLSIMQRDDDLARADELIRNLLAEL